MRIFQYVFLLQVVFLTSCSVVNKQNSGSNNYYKRSSKLARTDTIVRVQYDTVYINTDSFSNKLSRAQVDSVNYDVAIRDQLENHRLQGVYRQGDWVQTPNFNLRKPNYVIIHHTFQDSLAQTIRTFQLPRTKVSSHYIIGKDGKVVQMLNDFDRAWHAGRAKWGSATDINSSSIGIELDNNGFADFPEAQIDALLILLDTLKSKYLIPDMNFIAHADIAPTRKNDPHVKFPWKKLSDKGFGIWYDESQLVDPPANFNPIDALKIMGYDTRSPSAAIQAFKRKFMVSDVSKELTKRDQRVLYNLYLKYY